VLWQLLPRGPPGASTASTMRRPVAAVAVTGATIQGLRPPREPSLSGLIGEKRSRVDWTGRAHVQLALGPSQGRAQLGWAGGLHRPGRVSQTSSHDSIVPIVDRGRMGVDHACHRSLLSSHCSTNTDGLCDDRFGARSNRRVSQMERCVECC
jgi:hypothetical protein